MKHKYRRDRKAIQSVHGNICERCGKWTTIEPHHIFTRGAGGRDIRINLVQLCTDCHIAAHDGGIQRDELLAIVARRECMSVDDVYRRNRRAMGYDV